MRRYLQAIKNEVRNSLPAVIRGEPQSRAEVLPPYYDQRLPGQSYGQASGELSPQQLQMIIEHAKLQGAREELERSRAHVDATHHAHADRMVQVALAAVNKPGGGEIRYCGSAYDKRMRRNKELKWLAIGGAALAGAVLWASWHESSPPPPVQHKHYERHESWDDR